VKEVLESAIRAKNSDEELWYKSVEAARQIIHTRDLSDDELVKLALSSETPESFNILVKYIYKFTRSNPDGHKAIEILFNSVDGSTYSLKEWTVAIEFFHHWLEKEERVTSWPTMLGYLCCCSESPEGIDVRHELVDLLRDMLETYGYDG